MIAAVFLCQDAAAQDPFTQLRGGAGDQMTSGFSDRNLNNTQGFVYGNAVERNYNQWFQTLYVPPVPPVLGEELHNGGPSTDRSSVASFEREIFFGGYAIIAGQGELSAKDTERVAAYHAARQQLLQEIQAKFEGLAGASLDARRVELAGLAAQQNDRLQALAVDAEAIRTNLDWAISIFKFRIAPRFVAFRFDRTAAEFSRFFTAAYFYGGLSAEQRFLLMEAAYEPPPGPDGKTVAWTAGDTIFFLPAMARIRLPASLPPALEEKLRAFTAEKDNLKSELRSAVLRDDFFFISTRTKRLTELAEQQAPRFAALEVLAEEIRVGLAGLGLPEQPVNPSLPADLTRRVGDFYTRKVEVQRELLTQLRQLRSKHPASKFEIVRQGDGLAIARTGLDPEPMAGLKEFNDKLAVRYAAFAGESEALRRDIQHYLERNPQTTARTVDQVAMEFGKAYAARENWDRYRYYSRAVLEPGLSPAQRRLLFNAAAWSLEHFGGSSQP
jgi:hypothetical protein